MAIARVLPVLRRMMVPLAMPMVRVARADVVVDGAAVDAYGEGAAGAVMVDAIGEGVVGDAKDGG